MTITPNPFTPNPLLVAIKRALKANFMPAIFLQVFAVCIAISYFYWPDSLVVFDFFANLKASYGVNYAMLSTAIFGGLIPYLYLLFSNKITHSKLGQCVFYLVVWAGIGALVNEFYEWQAVWFGNGADWLTIAKKTALDQFVFSMLLTCPLLTLAYLWKDQGFSWRATRPLLKTMLTLQVPTTVLTNWLIWIPAVSLIYAMPANLQIPLFNLVLCFFVLILAILNTEHTEHTEQPSNT